MGKNLNRFLQPAVLAALVGSDDGLHGYTIVNRLAESPMFGGQKPDPTGVYRVLHQIEADGYAEAEWDTSDVGPAKRRFRLTPEGRLCLERWVDTLGCYAASVSDLRRTICDSLEIPTPGLRRCHGDSHEGDFGSDGEIESAVPSGPYSESQSESLLESGL